METVERQSSLLFRAAGLLNTSPPAPKPETMEERYSEAQSSALSPSRRRKAPEPCPDSPVADAKVQKCGSPNEEPPTDNASPEDTSVKPFPYCPPELSQAIFSNILAALTSGGFVNPFACPPPENIQQTPPINGLALPKPRTSHAISDILGVGESSKNEEKAQKHSPPHTPPQNIRDGEERKPAEGEIKRASPAPPPLMNWPPPQPNFRLPPPQEHSPDFATAFRQLGGAGYLAGGSPPAFPGDHDLRRAPNGPPGFFPQKFGMPPVGLPAPTSPNAGFLWMRHAGKCLIFSIVRAVSLIDTLFTCYNLEERARERPCLEKVDKLIIVSARLMMDGSVVN